MAKGDITHNMRMARASSKELTALETFLRQLQEKIEETWDDYELGFFVREQLEKADFSVERITWGYRTLFQCACDPTLDYLEWNADIKGAKERLQAIQAAQIQLEMVFSDFYQSAIYHEGFPDSLRGDLDELHGVVQQLLAQ